MGSSGARPCRGPGVALRRGSWIGRIIGSRSLRFLPLELRQNLLEADLLVLVGPVALGTHAEDERVVVILELVDPLGGLALRVLGSLVDVEVDRLLGLGGG